MSMKHKEVTSSNVASVGYDKDSHILEVRFIGGGLYSYADVPASVHDELMSSPEGVGGRFHKLIKKGGYKWTKLE